MVLSPVRRTITPSLKAPHHEIVSPPTRTSRIRLQLDRAPMSPMFAHVDIAFGSPPASNAKPSSKYGAPCALALIEQVVIPIVNQRGQNPRGHRHRMARVCVYPWNKLDRGRSVVGGVACIHQRLV